ncbi:MAG: DUF393 domain-containing protein [Planctomycetaceae bacterium]|nr:DUF393 domain-containing protein [Planctomycetaceae bacterium]
MVSDYDIEMFYDGDCPLCLRETRLLQRLDSRQRIRFTNIAAAEFDPSAYGMTQDDFMREMHGRTADGTWLTGVEVFRRLYSAVGYGTFVRLTRLPGVSQLLSLGYTLFAKSRLRLTGRCTDKCRI